MTDPIVLRNRFAMVKGAWEEHLRGVPFPSLGEGTAEQKIERLELALVDEMRRRATPETAEQVADAMWGIVHARPEGDAVKHRVTRHHEELAKLTHRRCSGSNPAQRRTGSGGYLAYPGSPRSPRSHIENTDPRVVVIARWCAQTRQRPGGTALAIEHQGWSRRSGMGAVTRGLGRATAAAVRPSVRRSRASEVGWSPTRRWGSSLIPTQSMRAPGVGPAYRATWLRRLSPTSAPPARRGPAAPKRARGP